MATVRTLEFSNSAQQARFAAKDLVRMDVEIEEMANLVTRIDPPIVLSHNDLLSGNILVPNNVRASGPLCTKL